MHSSSPNNDNCSSVSVSRRDPYPRVEAAKQTLDQAAAHPGSDQQGTPTAASPRVKATSDSPVDGSESTCVATQKLSGAPPRATRLMSLQESDDPPQAHLSDQDQPDGIALFQQPHKIPKPFRMRCRNPQNALDNIPWTLLKGRSATATTSIHAWSIERDVPVTNMVSSHDCNDR